MIRGYSRELRALEIWVASEQGGGVPSLGLGSGRWKVVPISMSLSLGSVVEGGTSLYKFGLLFAHCLVQYESCLLEVCMLYETQ